MVMATADPAFDAIVYKITSRISNSSINHENIKHFAKYLFKTFNIGRIL